MRSWIILFVLFLMVTSVHAQVTGTVRADTVERNGQIYLSLSGDGSEIIKICGAARECEQVGFSSRVDALNYFGTLLGQAKGFTVQPVPPAPTNSEPAPATEPMPCHPRLNCPPTKPPLPPYPCTLKPCIYPHR